MLAVALAAVFGYANDKLLWKPLRGRGTGLIAMMIVSIGLAIFLRNIYQYIFGADNNNYKDVPIQRRPWEVGPIDISARTFWSAVICSVVLILVSIAVQRTRLGKATRAVSDNPALAASSGIDVDRVILTIWVVGAALAGMSGILWGMNYGFDYQVGFKILLLVFASVTLGGLGTIWGTMAGALLVGMHGGDVLARAPARAQVRHGADRVDPGAAGATTRHSGPRPEGRLREGRRR